MLNWRVSVIDEKACEGKVFLFPHTFNRAEILQASEQRFGKKCGDEGIVFLIEHWDGEVDDEPQWDKVCRCNSDDDNPCVCN